MSFESVYRSKQGTIELNKVADFIGSLVIKNEYEANAAETSESLYEYIKYHGAYTGTDSFTDYSLDDRIAYKEDVRIYMDGLSTEYVLTPDLLNTITNYRVNTLEERYGHRDKLIVDYLHALRVARVYHYDEKNLYYRQFVGKPAKPEDTILVINKDVGNEGYSLVDHLTTTPNPNLDYFTRKYDGLDVTYEPLGRLSAWYRNDENGIPQLIAENFYYLNSVPIHDVTRNAFPMTYNYYILQQHIEEIIAANPTKYYVRFVGKELTPFYIRNLENYSILTYDNKILNSTELHYFFKAFDKAKKQVIMDYITGFDQKQPIYNVMMIQNLLYYTVINYSSSYIERYSLGIYTEENCNDILASHGYTSLIAIKDLELKQRIVRNLSELISNKGNNYVLEIILSKILKDENSELKRFYLEKKYNVDETSSIEIDTTKGLEDSVHLVFREVPALSINELAVSVDSYRDYDEFIATDNLWGGIDATDSKEVIATKRDLLKKKLLSTNFNSILTKYITLTRTVDILDSQRTVRDLLYLMLKNIGDTNSDEFFKSKVDFDKYSVTPAGLFAAMCWLQQMKSSKAVWSTTGLHDNASLIKRFDDADIICKDECVINSSVVFRKLGTLAVDVNELENNVLIINGVPVKTYDISPEVASWRVVDFIKENPDLFEALLEDIDLYGPTIPTARLADIKSKNGKIRDKGILTMEYAISDGFKHLINFDETIEDFLTVFRYYRDGKQLGDVTKATTFSELVTDYKNQYPNLINKITSKLAKCYDFREYQAWQYMLLQSRTNNSIYFIFKEHDRFSDYLEFVESAGLMEYMDANIRLRDGKHHIDDIVAVQNEIYTAFQTWTSDSFSNLIFQGGGSSTDGTAGDTTVSDKSFVEDMKLLFDEFLSVFSQLYSVDYSYSFGSSAESSGLHLQMFYNPMSVASTDKYSANAKLGYRQSMHSTTTGEDLIEVNYGVAMLQKDSFYQNVNNDIEHDPLTDKYTLDDQLQYEFTSNYKDSFLDNVSISDRISIKAVDKSHDSIGLKGILKVKSSLGEKVYYE